MVDAGLLRRAHGQNHFFVGSEEVPGKLEPGNVNHELTAALPGIVEYLSTLGDGPDPVDLQRVFDEIAAHESELAAPLLAFLDEHPKVTLHGPSTADARRRVPTISFTIDGLRSSELPPKLDARGLAVRFGHFHAYRAIRDMGLMERDGVVRASMVHYNTPGEVQRLMQALDELLPGA